jgi:hypothetical protein
MHTRNLEGVGVGVGDKCPSNIFSAQEQIFLGVSELSLQILMVESPRPQCY